MKRKPQDLKRKHRRKVAEEDVHVLPVVAERARGDELRPAVAADLAADGGEFSRQSSVYSRQSRCLEKARRELVFEPGLDEARGLGYALQRHTGVDS